MGISQSLSLAWNVMMVDRGTQGTSTSDTVIHAMAGRKANGDMLTPCEAKQAADAYISDPANNLYRRIHAAQDRAAPWHYGQPWSDDLTFSDKAGHIWSDVFYGDAVGQAAFYATGELLGAGP